MCSDATRLQLKNPFPSEDVANTLGKIRVGEEISDADKLDPLENVSDYFTEAPVEGKLHLVVQVPLSGEYQTCTTSAFISRRSFVGILTIPKHFSMFQSEQQYFGVNASTLLR